MMNSKKGFTLIELMVSVTIIAILVAAGTVVYSSAQKNGRISKRAQDLQAIQTALELYKGATGSYPSHTAASTLVCISGPLAGLAPTYMPVLPADPLDSGDPAGTNCYQYASNATSNSADYKLRTNQSIYTSGEMTSPMFLTQPTLIDSDRDGTADDNCTIQRNGTVQGWALNSGLAAMCNL